MSDPVVFPIPERVSAVFIVAAPQYIRADLKKGLVRQVDASFGRLDLRIEVLAVDAAPMIDFIEMIEDPAYAGPLAKSIRRKISRAREFIQIQCSGPPGWPPVHVLRAAYLTQLEGLLAGGIPIDLAGGWPIVERLPLAIGEPPEFVITKWIRVAAFARATVTDLRTVGLARLGCPELAVDRIPTEIFAGWANILNGLARKLLITQWGILHEVPDQAFRQLTNPVTLDSATVQGVIDCGHSHPFATAHLHLRYDLGDPDTGPLLRIGQPETATRAREDWLRETVDRLGRCAHG